MALVILVPALALVLGLSPILLSGRELYRRLGINELETKHNDRVPTILFSETDLILCQNRILSPKTNHASADELFLLTEHLSTHLGARCFPSFDPGRSILDRRQFI